MTLTSKAMPILQIRHLTRYSYRQPVGFGEHRIMYRPRESYDQHVLASHLTIGPDPSHLRHLQDVFGNCVAIARFEHKATELRFESVVTLEHTPQALVLDIEDEAGPCGPAYDPDDLADLRLSIAPQHADEHGALRAWAERFLNKGRPTRALALLAEMTHAIRQDFSYCTRLRGAAQSPAQTLESKTGSCRDFAVLMIEAVRQLGFAARFVSGYIYSPARVGGARLGGGHTHAWVRVYLPSCGWVEFDPTNGIVGNTDLIRVAVVRDPVQATPLHGSWFGPASYYRGMEVEVDVSPVDEPATDRRVALAAAG
jgi:transglutaminase-like putative cysteine protease